MELISTKQKKRETKLTTDKVRMSCFFDNILENQSIAKMYIEYNDKGKYCQFRLLKRTSFIGQSVQPAGEKIMR